jgi:hypothetical protein
MVGGFALHFQGCGKSVKHFVCGTESVSHYLGFDWLEMCRSSILKAGSAMPP